MRRSLQVLSAPTKLAGGDAPSEILILPAGQVQTDKGPYLLDRTSADRIIARFNQHGVELPIDIEHAIIVKAEKGEPAPAIGWITRLAFREASGLIATVRWTTEGKRAIQARRNQSKRKEEACKAIH